MRSPYIPTHPMDCIQRRERGATGAWYVSFERNCQCYAKNFADRHYGGRAHALTAAQLWRDEQMRDAQPMTGKDYFSLLRKNNTTGVTGVFRIKSARPNKDGSACWNWIALSSTKPTRARCFSVAKHGEQGAFEKAVAARAAFIAEQDAPFLVKRKKIWGTKTPTS